MNNRFFKDRKVMITGHTGFIGSWLTKWLSMMNADILGYSLDPPTKPNMYEAIRLSKDIRDLRKDIRDKRSLKDAIYEFQPELVFHLAAQPIVLRSYDSPAETFDTNIMGTVNLLDILRKTKSTRVIVVMTSDKVYKNNEWVYPYREIDPLSGKDPYSASKSCQDIVVSSFRESYFARLNVNVSTLRAGNVIGGGDWGEHRIIPDLVRGLTENKIVKIRNPESVRPWQYVLDLVSGMMKLAQRMWGDIKLSDGWNFGPNNQREVTVKGLADRFIEYWGTGSYSVIKGNDEIEANHLELDISKAKNKLSWIPKYNFEESVEKTVEWYKEYYRDPSSAYKITENQINTYLKGQNEA